MALASLIIKYQHPSTNIVVLCLFTWKMQSHWDTQGFMHGSESSLGEPS